MNVYDSWLFHDRSEYYPRFFISNAVWREETSIDTAISKRINILASTITKFNTNNPEKIKSITIECLTLGSWGDHSDDKKHRAIRLVKEKLQETFGIICD
jgi:hypothetical protein